MKWSTLKTGDIVDIVAPASRSPLERLDAGCEWLRAVGLTPRVPTDIMTKEIFFASALETQLEQLKTAIYSDSKAIWCLRGGYGSMRLIPHLLKLKPPRKSKIFLGFSDITALHLFFTQHWKWSTIHSRTISQMTLNYKNTTDRKLLKDVLFGAEDSRIFSNLKPLNTAARSAGNIKGRITGGSLRIVQSSLGTPWEIQVKGKILFLEDVSERGYSIDRMLEQLIQARIIDTGLKAVVFGDFTEGQEKDGKDLTGYALKSFAEKVNYPVFTNLPAGHGKIKNSPIPFNTPCELKSGLRGQLTCTYGGAE